jgi:hypothetical protein
LLGFGGEVLLLTLLFPGEVAQAVVFPLGVGRRAMVEGWVLVFKSTSREVFERLEEAYHHRQVGSLLDTCLRDLAM